MEPAEAAAQQSHLIESDGFAAAKQQHRANTTMHVCWHRNTSVSALDNHHSLINQLSGYLLRKFKNSNGWQKLWVVFSNFCLFFYKTYQVRSLLSTPQVGVKIIYSILCVQDEFPLASLPLLGYTITIPNENDGINKDYVFKLKFKNHVYFFRAESQYSFNRCELKIFKKLIFLIWKKILICFYFSDGLR